MFYILFNIWPTENGFLILVGNGVAPNDDSEWTDPGSRTWGQYGWWSKYWSVAGVCFTFYSIYIEMSIQPSNVDINLLSWIKIKWSRQIVLSFICCIDAQTKTIDHYYLQAIRNHYDNKFSGLVTLKVDLSQNVWQVLAHNVGILMSFYVNVTIKKLFVEPFDCDVIMKKSAIRCDFGPLVTGQWMDFVNLQSIMPYNLILL